VTFSFKTALDLPARLQPTNTPNGPTTTPTHGNWGGLISQEAGRGNPRRAVGPTPLGPCGGQVDPEVADEPRAGFFSRPRGGLRGFGQDPPKVGRGYPSPGGGVSGDPKNRSHKKNQPIKVFKKMGRGNPPPQGEVTGFKKKAWPRAAQVREAVDAEVGSGPWETWDRSESRGEKNTVCLCARVRVYADACRRTRGQAHGRTGGSQEGGGQAEGQTDTRTGGGGANDQTNRNQTDENDRRCHGVFGIWGTQKKTGAQVEKKKPEPRRPWTEHAENVAGRSQATGEWTTVGLLGSEH